MCGIETSPCDDHYQPTNATWACDLTGCLTAKIDKVSYDMTQISRVLTIATVFTGSDSNIYLARAGGGLICKSEIPVQELWLKMGGAYMQRGA